MGENERRTAATGGAAIGDDRQRLPLNVGMVNR